MSWERHGWTKNDLLELIVRLSPDPSSPIPIESLGKLMKVSGERARLWLQGKSFFKKEADKLIRLEVVLNAMRWMMPRDSRLKFLEEPKDFLKGESIMTALNTWEGYYEVLKFLNEMNEGGYG